MHIRPPWDEYWMAMVDTASTRATCNRGRSACVIVKDNDLLVTGYVGSPRNLPHCDDIGHKFQKRIHEDGRVSKHCIRTIHAEQNAICQAAKRGISIYGGTMYVTMTPCLHPCAYMLINCGIKRVVCKTKYKLAYQSEEAFEQAGIDISYINDWGQEYEKE